MGAGSGVHRTPPGVLDSATLTVAMPVSAGPLVLMMLAPRPTTMPPAPILGTVPVTSVVVGVLFLACLFVSPLAGMVPKIATAPVLIIVGYFMMIMVKDINWADPGIGIPALLTVVVMPFTFSITNGVGAGFIAYTVIAMLRGRAREVHWLMYLVSAVFGWYFFHGVVG